MNIVVILAGGIGLRFKGDFPKQYEQINKKMLIEYVINSALKSSEADKVVIVADEKWGKQNLLPICQASNMDLIVGGNTRNKSLKNALIYISNNYNCDKLIVCDAVRPLVTSKLIDLYFEYLEDYSAVVTAQEITDSLGCYKFKKINRQDYYLMQSPEGFDFELLNTCFDENSQLTEVTQQLPGDSKIKLYFEFKNNFKVTYPEDLEYLKSFMSKKNY